MRSYPRNFLIISKKVKSVKNRFYENENPFFSLAKVAVFLANDLNTKVFLITKMYILYGIIVYKHKRICTPQQKSYGHVKIDGLFCISNLIFGIKLDLKKH